VLDYLEAELPADAGRWPKTAAFVEGVLGLGSFEKLKPFEERLMRTPIAQHRAVLAEMGAPLTRESYGTTSPRRGMMRL
jgi:glutathione S-transferase